MPSESARMTTAAAARFRIDAPNSRPRAVKVIALDPPSERVVERLAQSAWQGAAFFTSVKFDGAPRGGEGWSMKAWLGDLAGRTDLIVMVASAGTNAAAAAVIAEACGARKVMTTALIIESETKTDAELSKTLATLRPHASMLVIANNDDYIEAMLAALRA